MFRDDSCANRVFFISFLLCTYYIYSLDITTHLEKISETVTPCLATCRVQLVMHEIWKSTRQQKQHEVQKRRKERKRENENASW